eukprot:g32953.t1
MKDEFHTPTRVRARGGLGRKSKDASSASTSTDSSSKRSMPTTSDKYTQVGPKLAGGDGGDAFSNDPAAWAGADTLNHKEDITQGRFLKPTNVSSSQPLAHLSPKTLALFLLIHFVVLVTSTFLGTYLSLHIYHAQNQDSTRGTSVPFPFPTSPTSSPTNFSDESACLAQSITHTQEHQRDTVAVGPPSFTPTSRRTDSAIFGLEQFRWSSTEIVLINLKRRPERFQHILELTRQLPMLDRVQVFEALDGELLGEDGLRKYAAEHLRIDRQVIPATHRYGKPLSIAGTLLSHLSVWEDFLERSEAQFLLVLEDDLLMPAGMEDTKAALWELEGVEFDIVWLEYYETNSTLTNGRGRFLEVEAETEHATIWGLGASVFSREAVRRLVAAVRRDPAHSPDVYAIKELVQDKFYVKTSRPLRACISQPAVFQQDVLSFDSDNRLFNIVQQLVYLLNDAMTEANQTLALEQYLRIVTQGRHKIDQNHNNFINYTRHTAAEVGDVKESDMETGLLRVLSICFETVWKLENTSKETISHLIYLMRLDGFTELQMSALTMHLDPNAAQLLHSARASLFNQASASASRENVPEQFRWSSTQVVLINLKRRPERLQHMLELTRQLPMLDRVQVFEALDGELLGEDGLRKYAAERLSIDKEVIPATNRSGKRLPVAGTLLSHLSVWVDFLERSEAQFLLVLEDDLFMPAGEEDTKAALWELEGVEFDIVWLEYHLAKVTLYGSGRFLEVEAETEHATIWGLGASVFSREAVRRMVAAVRRNPVRAADDYAMRELIQDKFYVRTSRPLRACISQPAVFQQDLWNFESDNRLLDIDMQELVYLLNDAMTEANQTLALEQYLRIVTQGRHKIDQNHNNFINHTRHTAAEVGDVTESDMETDLLRVLSICFETVWKLCATFKEPVSQVINLMRLGDLTEPQMSTLTMHLDPKAAQLLQSARASLTKRLPQPDQCHKASKRSEDLSNHPSEKVAEQFRWSSTEIVLINLKRRPERLQHMLELTRQLPMLDRVRVFEAIDGKLLGEDGLRKYAAEQLRIDREVIPATDRQGRPVSVAGTLLSHLSVWEDFLERSEAQFLLVLEDDLFMSAGVEDTKTALWELEGVEFDIVWLEYTFATVTVYGSGRYKRVDPNEGPGRIFGTGASILSREAVRRMVAAVRDKPNIPADWYEQRVRMVSSSKRTLVALISQPPVLQQDLLKFESDIRQPLSWKVYRLMRQLENSSLDANTLSSLLHRLAIELKSMPANYSMPIERYIKLLYPGAYHEIFATDSAITAKAAEIDVVNGKRVDAGVDWTSNEDGVQESLASSTQQHPKQDDLHTTSNSVPASSSAETVMDGKMMEAGVGWDSDGDATKDHLDLYSSTHEHSKEDHLHTTSSTIPPVVASSSSSAEAGAKRVKYLFVDGKMVEAGLGWASNEDKIKESLTSSAEKPPNLRIPSATVPAVAAASPTAEAGAKRVKYRFVDGKMEAGLGWASNENGIKESLSSSTEKPPKQDDLPIPSATVPAIFAASPSAEAGAKRVKYRFVDGKMVEAGVGWASNEDAIKDSLPSSTQQPPKHDIHKTYTAVPAIVAASSSAEAGAKRVKYRFVDGKMVEAGVGWASNEDTFSSRASVFSSFPSEKISTGGVDLLDVVTINLKRHQRRRKHIEELYSTLGWGQARFHDALDADELGKEGLRQVAAKLGVGTPLTFASVGGGNPITEMSLLLSNLQILLSFLSSNRRALLVLEDDVALRCTESPPTCRAAFQGELLQMQRRTNQYDIAYLEHAWFNQEHISLNGSTRVKTIHVHGAKADIVGAAAILYSRRGAAKYVRLARLYPNLPHDFILGLIVMDPSAVSLLALPPLLEQDFIAFRSSQRSALDSAFLLSKRAKSEPPHQALRTLCGALAICHEQVSTEEIKADTCTTEMVRSIASELAALDLTPSLYGKEASLMSPAQKEIYKKIYITAVAADRSAQNQFSSEKNIESASVLGKLAAACVALIKGTAPLDLSGSSDSSVLEEWQRDQGYYDTDIYGPVPYAHSLFALQAIEEQMRLENTEPWKLLLEKDTVALMADQPLLEQDFVTHGLERTAVQDQELVWRLHSPWTMPSEAISERPGDTLVVVTHREWLIGCHSFQQHLSPHYHTLFVFPQDMVLRWKLDELVLQAPRNSTRGAHLFVLKRAGGEMIARRQALQFVEEMGWFSEVEFLVSVFCDVHPLPHDHPLHLSTEQSMLRMVQDFQSLKAGNRHVTNVNADHPTRAMGVLATVPLFWEYRHDRSVEFHGHDVDYWLSLGGISSKPQQLGNHTWWWDLTLFGQGKGFVEAHIIVFDLQLLRRVSSIYLSPNGTLPYANLAETLLLAGLGRRFGLTVLRNNEVNFVLEHELPKDSLDEDFLLTRSHELICFYEKPATLMQLWSAYRAEGLILHSTWGVGNFAHRHLSSFFPKRFHGGTVGSNNDLLASFFGNYGYDSVVSLSNQAKIGADKSNYHNSVLTFAMLTVYPGSVPLRVVSDTKNLEGWTEVLQLTTGTKLLRVLSCDYCGLTAMLDLAKDPSARAFALPVTARIHSVGRALGPCQVEGKDYWWMTSHDLYLQYTDLAVAPDPAQQALSDRDVRVTSPISMSAFFSGSEWMQPKQTINMLVQQMLQTGRYSAADVARVMAAYRLAVLLSGSWMRLGGRPLSAHLVGTASLTVSLGQPLEATLVMLLHSINLFAEVVQDGQPVRPAREDLQTALGNSAANFTPAMRRLILGWNTYEAEHINARELQANPELADQAVLAGINFLEEALAFDKVRELVKPEGVPPTFRDGVLGFAGAAPLETAIQQVQHRARSMLEAHPAAWQAALPQQPWPCPASWRSEASREQGFILSQQRRKARNVDSQTTRTFLNTIHTIARAPDEQ